MRVASFVLALFVLVSACGTDASTRTDLVESQTPEMMAAALVELISENHGFGEQPSPFTVYLIQTRIDPSATIVNGPTDDPVRPLTETEMRAIENAVSKSGVVRWIDEPAEWQTPDLTPSVDGAAILGVGEPVVEDQSGLVPVSMWCGGLCGTWLTYRLELINEAWTVTDIEGPIAVS